jgi:hypothetical protein
MQRIWKATYPWLGVIVLGYLIVYHACRYGSHWRFNERAVPVPIMGSDANLHPDGTEINPVDLYLVRTGQQEFIWYVFYAICISSLGLIICCYRLVQSLRVRETKVDALIRELESRPVPSQHKHQGMP